MAKPRINKTDAKDIRILRCITEGENTGRLIAKTLGVDSPDSLRHRFKKLEEMGLVSSSLMRMSIGAGGAMSGASRPNVRHYYITRVGEEFLAADLPGK